MTPRDHRDTRQPRIEVSCSEPIRTRKEQHAFQVFRWTSGRVHTDWREESRSLQSDSADAAGRTSSGLRITIKSEAEVYERNVLESHLSSLDDDKPSVYGSRATGAQTAVKIAIK